jgi:hypothetical protein
MSGGSPRSEDPHRHERKLMLKLTNPIPLSLMILPGFNLYYFHYNVLEIGQIALAFNFLLQMLILFCIVETFKAMW